VISVTGGPDLGIFEVNEACMLIQEEAHEDANIIFGAVIDEKMKDEMRITVIATGFGRADSKEERVSEAAALSPEREKVVVNFARKEENREIPAFLRSEKPKEVQERIARAARGRVSSNLGMEDEYDIPTFLRKQAD
jgi:cell division protein FtsZ